MTSDPPPSPERLLGPEVAWQPAAWPDRGPLQGPRVVLRPIDPASDAEPLFRLSHLPVGDPEIWRYLFEGPFENVEQFRRWLEIARSEKDRVFFTVERLPEREPEGVASYLRITPEHGTIEIGNIWFGPPLQRTAAATEAIYLLVARAFDQLGYRRVEWKCNALNQGSRRAAERFGFQFEGVFRQHMVIKGRNRDTAWYAILDHEWPQIRAGFEAWLSPENFDQDGVQRRSLQAVMAR
jgi:RimJ/RimL family protein N-acetyltransferase